MTRSQLALLVAAASIVVAPSHAAMAQSPTPSQPASAIDVTQTIATDPADIVYRLLCSYAARDVEGFASCLTSDFRFLHAEPESRARWPEGWTRTDEIESAAHLFSGHVRDGRRLPAAQEIHITYARMLRWADTTPGGATDRYFVEPTELRLFIRFTDGSEATFDGTHQVFRIVRGDVALLPHGSAHDASRWYVQRWAEEHGSLAEALDRAAGDAAAQTGAERIEAVCRMPF